MDRTPVGSSTVKSVGYSPETKILHVEFNSGGLYEYANVPQEVYDRFLASESKGSFFATWIRANYEVTHLNPRPKEETHGESTAEVESKSVQKRKAAQIKTKSKVRKRIS